MIYQIEYLPIAFEDIKNIVKYISEVLDSPLAAQRIALEIVSGAESLCNFPYSQPVYFPVKKLLHEYRKLLVKNYTIFYWIEEERKVVTVARVLFNRRDVGRLL